MTLTPIPTWCCLKLWLDLKTLSHYRPLFSLFLCVQKINSKFRPLFSLLFSFQKNVSKYKNVDDWIRAADLFVLEVTTLPGNWTTPRLALFLCNNWGTSWDYSYATIEVLHGFVSTCLLQRNVRGLRLGIDLIAKKFSINLCHAHFKHFNWLKTANQSTLENGLRDVLKRQKDFSIEWGIEKKPKAKLQHSEKKKSWWNGPPRGHETKFRQL